MEATENAGNTFDFNPEWLARYRMPESAARPGYEVTAKDLAVLLAAYGRHNILCVDPTKVDDDVWVDTTESELLRWSGHDHRRAVEPMCERLEESFCVLGAYRDNGRAEKVSFKIAPGDIREAHPASVDNPRIQPLRVDVRTLAGFRTVYAVPVYLRLLAWTYYPSLASLRVEDDDGTRAVAIARDDVTTMLGIDMRNFRPGYFNSVFRTVENDLARAGIAVSSRWVADGRRLSVFRIRWRHEGLAMTRMESEAVKVKPRRIRTTGVEAVVEPLSSPSTARETPVAPTSSGQRPRRLGRLRLPARETESGTVVALAPTVVPDGHGTASTGKRKASLSAWSPPPSETNEQRIARWQSCGKAVYGRGPEMFPDPTQYPDLDFMRRVQARISTPALFRISDDEWFDRLEKEGVVVPRYTVPAPFAARFAYDPYVDKMYDDARRKGLGIDDEDEDEEGESGGMRTQRRL